MGIPINLFAGGSRMGFPRFSFSGLYDLSNDGQDSAGKQLWSLILKTSGKLAFTKLDDAVDIFLYGGGGGGGNGGTDITGAGGGGGRTASQMAADISVGDELNVTIGVGGAAETDGGNTIYRKGSVTLTALGGTGAKGIAPGVFGGGSGEGLGGIEVSYTLERLEYVVRVTCTIGREGSTWYAWTSKVEVRMTNRTGTYSVNTFGSIWINSTQSVSIEGISGVSVPGQTFATVWEGQGTKVPIDVVNSTAVFRTHFVKGAYGGANQLYFYGRLSGGSTIIQNGIINAGNDVTSSTVGVSGTAGEAGPQSFGDGPRYGAGGGGGMLGNGPGYDGGAGGGGKGGSANADAQDATPNTASGGGGAGPNKTGGKGASGVIVIRNAR